MFIGLPVHTEAHYKVSYLSEIELFGSNSFKSTQWQPLKAHNFNNGMGAR